MTQDEHRDQHMILLRAMVEGDPQVRALMQEILGVQPWPYDDRVLRTPHCPRCGAPAQMLVGESLEPLAFCPDDDCATWNWDPTVPAERLLDDAQVMVERTEGTTTISEPHDPYCALATPGGGEVCTCSRTKGGPE